MSRAFGAGDARGAWVWKDAYEAAEAAVVLFIRRHGRAMRRHAGAGPEGPSAMLRMLEAVAALEPVPHQALRGAGPPPAVLDTPASRLRGVAGRGHPAG